MGLFLVINALLVSIFRRASKHASKVAGRLKFRKITICYSMTCEQLEIDACMLSNLLILLSAIDAKSHAANPQYCMPNWP